MKYLLGVDFGGSSSKATLLREDGVVAATASREYPTYYPENGWAEQDAEDSYNAACANIRELLEKTGVAPENVAALALDAATHTAVLLGEAGTAGHLLDGYPGFCRSGSVKERDGFRPDGGMLQQRIQPVDAAPAHVAEKA